MRRPFTVLPHGDRGRSFASLKRAMEWAEEWVRREQALAEVIFGAGEPPYERATCEFDDFGDAIGVAWTWDGRAQ
jgi:hypothetical protein